MTRMRAIVVIVIAAVAITAVIAVVAVVRPSQSAPAVAPATSPSISPSGSPRAASTPTAAGKQFLAQWTDGGRVIRRDQGNDTVSEGQAYGLLISLAVGDEKKFDQIWSWTKKNLQRADDLLSWQWSKGKVVDTEPASDADLDTARALVLAGTRFHDAALTKAGTTIADAIADDLTVETASGRILLPGLWAAKSEPYAYNPSYASPVAFAVLGAATKDPRWKELAAGTTAVTTTLLDASPLPPDWAQVHADGTVDAMPGPAGRGDSVVYGYDAGRLALRYAETCTSPATVALAAKLLPTLERSRTLHSVLDLGGTAQTTDQDPLSYASRAASAAAAGDSASADLATSARLARSTPTYYGTAWSVLGAFMLRSTVLGGCAPAKADS
ncbi:glycosyl hydrolase family 8 [Lacisediminihabitans changchengi]|uniref:Glycoside hydrolase n=1 Tax=Lacisediminihabitans changchengi TaxID=2787634 RepID=A0A934SMS4_9MICO|nr:glycosyl hydrolase family 8 [Lacisediminihabitans changchengi]MBK4347015.1 hypothetical protein [Lacisediminihabitans changchengi]MBK4347862.1 hypothetical protein [Lacisediminihabitans changchengi]